MTENSDIEVNLDLVSNFNPEVFKSSVSSKDPTKEMKAALNELIQAIKQTLEPDINDDFIEEAYNCGLISKTECKGISAEARRSFLEYLASEDPQFFEEMSTMKSTEYISMNKQLDDTTNEVYKLEHAAWTCVPSITPATKSEYYFSQPVYGAKTIYPSHFDEEAVMAAKFDDDRISLQQEADEIAKKLDVKYSKLEAAGVFKSYYEAGLRDRELTRIIDSRYRMVTELAARFGDFSVGEPEYPGVYDPVGEVIKQYRRKPLLKLKERDATIIRDFLIREFMDIRSPNLKKLCLQLVRYEIMPKNDETRKQLFEGEITNLIKEVHSELTCEIARCHEDGSDLGESCRQLFLVDRYCYYKDIYYPEVTDAKVGVLEDMIEDNTTRIRMMEHFDSVSDIDSKIEIIYGDKLSKQAKKVSKEFLKWFPTKSNTEKVIISFMELIISIPWLHKTTVKMEDGSEAIAFDQFVKIFNHFKPKLPKQWNYDFADTLFGMITVMRDVEELYVDSGVYSDFWEKSIPCFWGKVAEKYENNQLFAKIAKAFNS